YNEVRRDQVYRSVCDGPRCSSFPLISTAFGASAWGCRMTTGECNALARVLMGRLQNVERFLLKRHAPASEAPDLASEALVITYTRIIEGKVVLPENPSDHGPMLGGYMCVVGRRLLSARREAGDLFVRGARVGEVLPHENRYTMDVLHDLASALRA